MKLTEAIMAHISSIEDASTRCFSGEITKQEMKEAIEESIVFLKSHPDMTSMCEDMDRMIPHVCSVCGRDSPQAMFCSDECYREDQALALSGTYHQCPHGRDVSGGVGDYRECDVCFQDSDFAYDASRESI